MKRLIYGIRKNEIQLWDKNLGLKKENEKLRQEVDISCDRVRHEIEIMAEEFEGFRVEWLAKNKELVKINMIIYL